jgi:E3 ubiquitin-protein ligase SHPRH
VERPEADSTPGGIRRARQRIADLTGEINKSETTLTAMVVKGRFLDHLDEQERGADDMREECIICYGTSDDDKGLLLGCGHFFCKVRRVSVRASVGRLRGG